MADTVIYVATELSVQATGKLIAETVLEGLLRPGTPFFEAASEMTYETTRHKVVSILESSGRGALIGADLRASLPTPTHAKAEF
jgi:hypothetical protein